MHIHLDRKKLLLITFFLCCVLPACFTWFYSEGSSMSWTGLMLTEKFLLAGIAVYTFALLFKNFGHLLAFGIVAHILLLGTYLICFFCFPQLTNMAQQADLSLSMELVKPAYWVSLGLLLGHLALFTSTEIAFRRLSKQA